MILFEQEHGRHVWRLQAVEWKVEARLQVWPWYQPKGGADLMPCAARFGGGFAIPLDRLGELIEALRAIPQSDAC